MKNGTYKTIDSIHVFDCGLGQLRIAKGEIIEIDGDYGYVGDTRFPKKLLEYCESQLKRYRGW